jgi:YVTN family beta-propeller protein
MPLRAWLLILITGCGDDGVHHLPDAPPSTDAPADSDGSGLVYNCGTFTQDPGWTLTAGFHAVVIADATGMLSQPVAATVAGKGYGGKIYVVNQGDNTLRAVDPATGTTELVVAAAGWPTPPRLLTTITWDATSVFDGKLYVGDQGGDGDGDSTIFTVASSGAPAQFVTGPGPGLDDIYGLAFSTSAAYGASLFVTGDTDGAGVDWGRFDAAANGTAFSELAGTEGIAFDMTGAFGGGLFASRPATGGYAGDDSISRVNPDGTAGVPLLVARPGVHAIAFAPAGPFGGKLYAASWASQELFSVDPSGTVAVLASGLQLTNYDGNILAFSPDGRVLYVADRLANRLVCIEPL